MNENLEDVVVSMLRPQRAELAKLQRVAADYQAFQRSRREENERAIDICSRRIAELHDVARSAGTGAMPDGLNLFEERARSVLADAARGGDEELVRLWMRFAPARWLVGEHAAKSQTNSPAGPLGWERGAVPQNLETVLALVSDPDGHEQAEVSARALRDALSRWGTKIGARVVWRVVHELHFQSTVSNLLEAPCRAVEEALAKAGIRHAEQQRAYRLRRQLGKLPQPLVPMRESSLRKELAEAATASLLWESAVQHGLLVPSGHALEGAAFADLPHPIRPFMTLWRTGYSLSHVSEAAVILEALPIDLDPWPTNAFEKTYDAQFRVVFDAIRELMVLPVPAQRRTGFKSE